MRDVDFAPWRAAFGMARALCPWGPCLALVFGAVFACGAAGAQTPVLVPRILAETPHDPDSFIQGFVFHAGVFYESRGQYGQSELRRVDPATGRVDLAADLPEDVFAEGLALAQGRLYQLTWQEGLVYAWSLEDFAPLGQFMFMGEGWGLAFDGERLIVSDGTDVLRFFAPGSLAPLGQVSVTDRGEPVPMLNELEFIQGRVWANVWKTPYIAVIDPESGAVEAWIDCTRICERARWRPGGRDLNGIAHDPATGRIWITGKLWDTVYEIEAALPGE